MHRFWAMQTSNLFLQYSAGGLGMFDVAGRCNKLNQNFFWLLFLRSAILLATNTSQDTFDYYTIQDSIFIKTKQQEFIHPLILSPTHGRKKYRRKSKKIEFVFHLVLLGQTIELTNQKKRYQTTDNYWELRRTEDFSGLPSFSLLPSISMSWVWLFHKISTGTKKAVMTPHLTENRLHASADCCHCGCALPLRLSICWQIPDRKRKIKVISTTPMYSNLCETTKKLLKKPENKWSWWWLTDWGPRVSMVVGLDLDTNRHGIPNPQGWITPTTHKIPFSTLPGSWAGPESKDAPRGSTIL